MCALRDRANVADAHSQAGWDAVVLHPVNEVCPVNRHRTAGLFFDNDFFDFLDKVRRFATFAQVNRLFFRLFFLMKLVQCHAF